jgi:heme/copper-type cytochrome/quinol oxidase subunit 2
MDDNPISNPFDEDDRKNSSPSLNTSAMSPMDEGGTNVWSLLWMILGVSAICLGVLVAGAFFYFKPNVNSLVAQYFPSATRTPSLTPTLTATATVTLTPTFTATPNLTATQQALDITSTVAAIQSTATQIAGKWRVVFSDKFDSKKNGWPTGPSDDSYANITHTIADSVYTWDVTSHQDFIGWNRINKQTYTDFSFSADVKQTVDTGSSDAGLVFREDPNGNFYYFGVTNDQQYLLAVYYNGEWTNLVDWTESEVLQKDQPNRLTVITQGSHFVIFINGQYVNEASDDKIKKGLNGLAVELSPENSHAVYEFDNVEVHTK